jgi:hypothetical protein
LDCAGHIPADLQTAGRLPPSGRRYCRVRLAGDGLQAVFRAELDEATVRCPHLVQPVSEGVDDRLVPVGVEVLDELIVDQFDDRIGQPRGDLRREGSTLITVESTRISSGRPSVLTGSVMCSAHVQHQMSSGNVGAAQSDV